jgi:hypothetical protein
MTTKQKALHRDQHVPPASTATRRRTKGSHPLPSPASRGKATGTTRIQVPGTHGPVPEQRLLQLRYKPEAASRVHSQYQLQVPAQSRAAASVGPATTDFRAAPRMPRGTSSYCLACAPSGMVPGQALAAPVASKPPRTIGCGLGKRGRPYTRHSSAPQPLWACQPLVTKFPRDRNGGSCLGSHRARGHGGPATRAVGLYIPHHPHERHEVLHAAGCGVHVRAQPFHFRWAAVQVWSLALHVFDEPCHLQRGLLPAVCS